MNRVLLFAILIVAGWSCTKDDDKRYDWGLMDQNGNANGIVYNKTEAELVACLNTGNCEGNRWNPATQGYCHYYKIGEEKFCWESNGRHYGPVSEKFFNCWVRSSPYRKVACDNTCGNWYTRRKMTYKPTNQTRYSNVTYKQYCGDTAIRFNSSALFVVKDDADSLILLERSKTGSDFR